ncbi:DUF4153 domain-containing protein [Undibacterium sp. CY7W]|uniref:DUF4153 domain-containing protein n=1 Tax=Undibacterium rugosum TaxID=2762291 RepID=A0A923HYI4_9BURK|nr:DUF4153 domain-containing protein [Undibacterium rugosum]MBC3934523.1 DUF4153 domain-containing protein [Undibacterium rugosum]
MNQELSSVSRSVGLIRVVVAAGQALLLFLLYRAAMDKVWPALVPQWFFPLLLCGLSLPVMAISSLGQMRSAALLRWLAVLLLVLVLLTQHDWLRRNGWNNGWGLPPDEVQIVFPSPLLFFFSAVSLYVAQALKLAYEQNQQCLGSYPVYFDLSWKLLVQLVFSLIFVGALFALLYLGSALFMLLKLDFLKHLLEKDWFSIPVAVLSFACALHLTDMRPSIVRGIRNLLLVLLSWLLPVATLVLSGFLAALLFSGTELLWQTKHATNLLLSSCVVLVVLINTVFQDGTALQSAARILRWSARVACLLLPILAALALRALQLRIGQYGWSSDRVIAVMCALIALSYGLAYLRAALKVDGLLSSIAGVNIVMAYVQLAVVLAMFSPLLDPARIAVADQLARLQQGKVSAEQFDYVYLRFEGGRYGRAALEQLQQLQPEKALSQAATIRTRAAQALALTHRGRERVDVITPYEVWPQGAVLPQGFLTQADGTAAPWLSEYHRACLIAKTRGCDVLMQDMNHDGKPEVLVLERGSYYGGSLYAELSPGVWAHQGQVDLQTQECAGVKEALRAGQIKAVAGWDVLEAAGARLVVTPEFAKRSHCPQ